MAVTVRQGALLGLERKTRQSSKPYVSFLGVPYAKAPVGDLRFKPPVEHPGWAGEFKAFSEGSICVQYPLMSTQIIEGSEDCLYLNVFVPQMMTNEKKAVMVFIHGGGFSNGSASEYTPDYLLDENVIVVTINYRLNVLGFLNFDIDKCPGNMGLKDQRFAIKWVKENISAFGGDANNVTIFGESAGSASVHGHMLSPQSAGLFQKVIMQSGCLFNDWAFNRDHRETAFKFAKHMGCEKKDPKDIVDYLRTVSANDLVQCFSKVDDRTGLSFYKFVPSTESDAISNPFLPTCPEALAKTASSFPLISGINDMEGIIGMAVPHLKQLIDNIQTSEDIESFFHGRFNEENITKIKNFYLNNRNLECETTKLENAFQMLGDMLFIKDFHRGFEHLLKRNVTPVYNYEFKYDGEINALKNVLLKTKPSFRQSLKGACHADELNYLFYVKTFGFEPKADSPELKMCRTMSKLWTNFAKTGNPNSPNLSFQWENTSVDDPKYLSIDGDNTKMVNELLCGSRIELWESIENS